MSAQRPRDRLELVHDVAEEAFVAVYEQHHDFVRRSVRALGVPDLAADDVAQEVFMVVHRRLPSFDHRAPVKAWVFGIARNLARKYRERHRRVRPHLQLLQAGPAAPDEALKWREAADVVERFVAELREDMRAVFVLCEVEGLTAPEVAEALGMKLNTVYSRLRATRARFARTVARAEAQRQRGGVHGHA